MKTYDITLTENAIHNMMDTYVEHKRMMMEYENDGETEDSEYTFHQGCCETAECWMRLLEISPSCNYITEKLWNNEE